MSIVIKIGDQVAGSPIQVDDVMKRPASKRRVSEGLGLVVSVNDPNKGAVELSTYESKKETSINARNCKYDFGVSVNGNDCRIVTSSNEKKVETTNETPTTPDVITDDKSTNKDESEAPAKIDATSATTETDATETSSDNEDFVAQKEAAKAEAAIELAKAETEIEPDKGDTVEKDSESEGNEEITTTKEPEAETEVSTESVNEETISDEDKYIEYEKMMQPKIKTKRNGPARDANGRFVSSKKKGPIDDFDDDDGRPAKKRSKNKTKSNFIPAKD